MISKIILQNLVPMYIRSLRIPSIKTCEYCVQTAAKAHNVTILMNRFYSQDIPNSELLIADFDHVKKAINDKNILIVDVREPDEIKEHGAIPNSINIPLGTVSTVFSTMPEKVFVDTFQRVKPEEDTEIIFYCMIGRRSGMAQQNLLNLGYKNVKNYVGSWTEWVTKRN